MKRAKLIGGIVVTLIIGYFVWWVFFTTDFFYRHSMNAGNRNAMMNVRENIRVGDNYENVLRAYWQNASPHLRLTPYTHELWTVSMPHEILTTDWVMYIEFSESGVSAIKVRTSDGPHPHDAPEDLSR